MLTKTINIEPAALEVIGAMEWRTEGTQTVGVITGGQLDRKVYVAVNKGLDALGGKWNKKAGGHLFGVDPRPQIEAMLDTGRVIVERDGFFPTPEPVVLQMMEMVELREPILEPSAGEGAICDVLRANGWTDIIAIEKNPQRRSLLEGKGYTVCSISNFLDYHNTYATIVMNPPFEQSQDIDHITHAFENCLEEGGELVSVVSEGPFFRSDMKAAMFRDLVDLYGYSEILADGAFKESGTFANYRLK